MDDRRGLAAPATAAVASVLLLAAAFSPVTNSGIGSASSMLDLARLASNTLDGAEVPLARTLVATLAIGLVLGPLALVDARWASTARRGVGLILVALGVVAAVVLGSASGRAVVLVCLAGTVVLTPWILEIVSARTSPKTRVHR